MKFTIKQIEEYLKLKLTPEKLAETLRTHLGEVEEFTYLAEKYQGIVLGTVVEVSKHPTRKHLQIVKVDIGNTTKQVLAGGPTLSEGDRVAYIPVGYKIPNNLHPEKGDVLQKVIIDGIESDGVLPSEKELDISNDHTKVWTIETKLENGTPIIEVLDMDDYLIDVENKALTNRADCFGIIGLARDISGIQQTPFVTPQWFKSEHSNSTPLIQESKLLRVENKIPGKCLRYSAVVLKNVKIKKSPLWLQTYLAKVGIRSINNVVDITNYLMILTGQPLHAFDYDKVISTDPSNPKKANIIVRNRNNEQERITTLDGKSRKINEEAILICNTQNPIALGGVMGGENTEIDDNTTDIIIESANFDYIAIRKTSNKQGLFTDAVTRFARGQDPNMCMPVLQKAIELMQKLAEAKIEDSILDIYPNPRTERKIKISLSKARRFLALDIDNTQIKNILQNVELNSNFLDEDILEIKIPSYRNDLQIPEDIYEEIARLYGYENVRLSLPTRKIKPTKQNSMVELKKNISTILQGLGVSELISYLFVGQELYKKYNLTLDNAYHLTNSLSPDLEFIRPTLIPSMLSAISKNIKKGYSTISFYEFNQVFNKTDFNQEKQLPNPRHHLAISYSTTNKIKLSAYYQVKFFIKELERHLKAPKFKFREITKESKIPYHLSVPLNALDPNRRAVITFSIDNEEYILGIIGEPLLNSDIPTKTAIAEIDLEQLILTLNIKKHYQEPSKYPPVKRDLCFQFAEDIQYQDVEEILKKSLSQLTDIYHQIELKDIFQEDNSKLKQYTFSIKLQGITEPIDKNKSDKLYEMLIKFVENSGGKLKIN